MKVSVNSKIIVRHLINKILVGFFRFYKILKNIFDVELSFVLGVLHDSVCTFSDAFIFCCDEVVALLLVVEKEVDQIGLFNLFVVAIGVQLNVFGESLYVWVITAQNDASMVVVLVHLHKSLYLG